MTNRPLYENLDTTFVNLSALVKYLRHREFVGKIRVELNSYEADILLFEGNKISVREHDKISGKRADGEEAFQRLLIRAREAGGTIHVYQSVKEAIPEKPSKKEEVIKIEKIETIGEIAAPPVSIKLNSNGNGIPIPKPTNPLKHAVSTNGAAVGIPAKPVKKKFDSLANLPKFPFDLSNSVEAKAKRNRLDEKDWNVLLALTGELLGTIDKSLSEAKLDFTIAFSKARSEISADYPFLSPDSHNFSYSAGKVLMNEQVSGKLFVASISESLRRIFEKLGANPKFSDVYRNTVQKLLALINHRKPYYDKYFITPQIKKVLGV